MKKIYRILSLTLVFILTKWRSNYIRLYVRIKVVGKYPRITVIVEPLDLLQPDWTSRLLGGK